MSVRVAGIIPAAGHGTRLGAESSVQAAAPSDPSGPRPPKALLAVAGVSLLRRSAEALRPCIDQLVVAAPEGWLDRGYDDLVDLGVEVLVVAGGATRQESVHHALAAVSTEADYVLVHDAARPLVPPDVCRRVLDALEGGAPVAVPAVEVADSLRDLGDDGKSAVIDRARIRAVQTPQGFRAEVLRAAHERAAAAAARPQPTWVAADGRRGAPAPATDDASLVERDGVPVTLVEGSALAFKVTTPLDLLLCESVLAASGR